MVIGTSYAVTAEDEGMMQFVLDAFASADKLEESAVFPEKYDSCSPGCNSTPLKRQMLAGKP